MKLLTVWLMVLCLVGCTTLRPYDGGPAAIRREVASGTLLKHGDHVLITTADWVKHKLTVTSVDRDAVHGSGGESIPVESIVGIEARQFSAGKTWGIIGSALFVGLALVAVKHSVNFGPGIKDEAEGAAGPRRYPGVRASESSSICSR